ncbi:MAG: DNA-deoxyinosine glycosylase [Nitrosomonas sp.]
MAAIHSFEPVVGPHANILILGSMPGEASLAAHQYYAHPRNAFWPIISPLLDIGADAPYSEKITALISSPIALWDVFQSCERNGSLDAMIRPDNYIINDFASLFSHHKQIRYVFFNGGTAERYFTRHVLVTSDFKHLQRLRLPSTSPANASLSFDQKRVIWHEKIQAALI